MGETYEQAMTRTGFTEVPAVARADAPLLVLQIGCDACSGAFVADGELASRLRATPAHTAVMTGGYRPPPRSGPTTSPRPADTLATPAG